MILNWFLNLDFYCKYEFFVRCALSNHKYKIYKQKQIFKSRKYIKLASILSNELHSHDKLDKRLTACTSITVSFYQLIDIESLVKQTQWINPETQLPNNNTSIKIFNNHQTQKFKCRKGQTIFNLNQSTAICIWQIG